MLLCTQLLISALLAASVFGFPSVKRDGADPCKGLPGGSYSNTNKFRAVAFKPNGESPGTELVQKRTGNFSAGYSTTFTVGGWGTDHSLNEILDMTKGGITGSSPRWIVVTEVKDDAVPRFVVTEGSSPQPALVWCAVPNAGVLADSHPYDFLAANGRYDAWYLCNEKSTGLSRVAFNVNKNQPNSSFDPKSCTHVYLRLVPDLPF